MYVYIHSEKNLWTVGYYNPSGEFQPESDWSEKEDAADRVSFLNGGSDNHQRGLMKDNWPGNGTYGD